MRTTIRFNDKQQAELNLLKRNFHIDKDSEAVHLAVEWVNHYIQNVTHTFFPPSFDVILQKKLKTHEVKRKVYE